MKRKSVVIIGAGPAGLGVAYELAYGHKKFQGIVDIFDKNSIVGGLARTTNYKGYLFDVGPHRFYTKNQEVLSLWKNILKDEFIKVPRLTRMFYDNKMFLYPIDFKDLVTTLNKVELIRIGLSWLHAKLMFRNLQPKTFEEWITKNFGRRLFNLFFKTYTEKLWGVPCSQIGAEWASQRIKNLNFAEVVISALSPNRPQKAKTLVNEFYYPLKGAGYVYKKLSEKLKHLGFNINLNSQVVEVGHKGKKIVEMTVLKDGAKVRYKADYVFSSMPLTEFVLCLHPKPSQEILAAAVRLRYRDHITVNLIVKKKRLFPDNWIYIHSPEVQAVRVANYSNFSRKMSPSQKYSGISVEYFSFEGDRIWKQDDSQLVKLATMELIKLNLLNLGDVIDGFAVREPKAYPAYYLGYKESFEKLKRYVQRFPNLQLIGRGGMYKYNNQDHSIYSGMLAARNFLSGKNIFDTWAINEDAEYLEKEINDQQKH